MIDPSKLIAGATAVYGPDEMSKTYGEILQSRRSGDRCRRWLPARF